MTELISERKRPKPLRALVVLMFALLLGAIVYFVAHDWDKKTGPAKADQATAAQTTAPAESEQREPEESDQDDQQSLERRIGMEIVGELPEGAEYMPWEDIDGPVDSITSPLDPQFQDDVGIETPIFEEGYFRNSIAIGWQCSWISEAVRLVEEGDLTGANAAVDKLWSFRDLEIAQDFPNYATKMYDVAEPLRLGNTAKTKPYLDLNCPDETRVD